MSSPTPMGPVPRWPPISESASIRRPKSQYRLSAAKTRKARVPGPRGTGPLAARIPLDTLPERFVRLEGQFGEAAISRQLHRAVAAFELVVRGTQRVFRGKAVCPDEIDRREQ